MWRTLRRHLFGVVPLVGGIGMGQQCQLATRAHTVSGGLTRICVAQALDMEARCVAYTGTAYESSNKKNKFDKEA